MASGRFSKQAAPFFGAGRAINNGSGDTVVGGVLTGAPSGIGAQAWQQNLPGDRVIFSPADALAYSNNSVGNLYTGTYRYVGTRNNSTSSPTLGRAAFWDPTATGTGNNISSAACDALYQVNSDGNSAYLNTLFAGVYINNVTKGNWWWIQESGKASCQFRSGITGTAAIGVGVYTVSGVNNNNATDNGAFDQVSGGNIGTAGAAAANLYASIDALLMAHVGVAETLPANNNLALVDLFPTRFFRW